MAREKYILFKLREYGGVEINTVCKSHYSCLKKIKKLSMVHFSFTKNVEKRTFNIKIFSKYYRITL